jgi:hypothetical protein
MWSDYCRLGRDDAPDCLGTVTLNVDGSKCESEASSAKYGAHDLVLVTA